MYWAAGRLTEVEESVSGIQTDRISKKKMRANQASSTLANVGHDSRSKEDDQLGADLTLENTAAGFWNFSPNTTLRRRV
ncbi:hypothetical protein HPP92_007860 [Vanilla planifolia]|uniref:Uncharacterized protein n=1 Tax=Vanilla planifolia TaxID=51239 RepID=A0A835RDE1_VANPL|nr:hypothetical protein HPP92_007860 [Vanilla planifolia]